MAERDRGVGMKNVLIIGATGTLGSAVRQKLLKESNHHLTLFARSADQLDPNPQEQIIAGNVMNDADLDSAVKNQDAIFVALSGPLGVYAEKIIAAMKRQKVARLIFITSMGIYNEIPNSIGVGGNLEYNPVLRPYRDAADKIEATDLDYTIIRPGKFMRGPVDYEITHKGEPFGGKYVTISSIADLVLKLIDNEHLYCQESVGINTPA